MITVTIPANIGNERKEEIYKGEYVSITYYPDREVLHPKYYLQALIDKMFFPFILLRHEYRKRKYSIVLGRKGSGKTRVYLKPIDINEN